MQELCNFPLRHPSPWAGLPAPVCAFGGSRSFPLEWLHDLNIQVFPHWPMARQSSVCKASRSGSGTGLPASWSHGLLSFGQLRWTGDPRLAGFAGQAPGGSCDRQGWSRALSPRCLEWLLLEEGGTVLLQEIHTGVAFLVSWV